MADLLHRIQINAPAKEVLDAISTQKGLTSWWTSNAEVQPIVGHINIFRFNQGSVEFHFRVDEHLYDGITWTCVQAEKVPSEWINTQISFELTEENGRTTVNFAHSQWKNTSGEFPQCNTIWGALMHHLKNYVETKQINPYFKEQLF